MAHTRRHFMGLTAVGVAGLCLPCDLRAQQVVGRVEGIRTDGVSLVNARADEDLYPVNVNNWWGLMNLRGQLVVYPRFDWTDYNYDSLTRAIHNGKTGFLKHTGEWQIQPAFPWADRFEEGYAIVGDGKGAFGFINRAGREVVPGKLEGALRFREGFAAVMVDGKVGFIDVRGNAVIPPRFASARSFHDGRAAVRLFDAQGQPRGALGYIDKRGVALFADSNGELADLGDFVEGLAKVQSTDGKWGFMDKRFTVSIPVRYDAARDFVNGMAAVMVDKKWGYIDKAGRVLIEPQFDEADDFDDVWAMIRIGKDFGYANKNATRSIRPQFAFAEPFYRRYAKVAAEPSFGYIDSASRVIWDPKVALKAIRDLTPASQIRAATDTEFPGTRLLEIPPSREQPPIPYEPEYQYEPVLPQRRK